MTTKQWFCIRTSIAEAVPQLNDAVAWDSERDDEGTWTFTVFDAVADLGDLVWSLVFGGSALREDEDYTVRKNVYNMGIDFIEYLFNGSGNYYGTVHATVYRGAVVSIADADVSVTNATYTGKDIEPEVTVTLGGKKLVRNKDYSVEYKNNKNAGTASVIVTGIGAYEGTAPGSFTIARAAIAVPKAANATYDGKAHTGVAAGTGYALSGTTSATNAGTYKPTATPDANHKWTDGTTAAKTIEWSIARASVAVPKAANATYDGKAHTGVAAGAGYALAGTTSATNAGTYKPTATPDSNHKWADGTTTAKTVEWSIARASVAVPKATNATYDGKAHTGVAAGTGYALSGSASATNAGTYKATATLDSNHKWSDGTTSAKTVEWKIAKAASSISLAAQTKTYTGKALTHSGKVTKSGSAGKVTYAYYSDAKCTKAVAAANVKAAGTYYVKAILAADANHNGASATAKLTVAKAASSISLAAQTKNYTGKALAYTGKVTKSGSAGKVTYAYYSDAKCTKSVKAANVKAAGTYYVKATLAADANHKAATSAAVKLTIAKAAQPMAAKVVARTASFKTLKSKSVTVTVPLSVTKAQGKLTYAKVSGDACLTINKTTGKVTVKKGTKKGTYTIKIRVSAAGNKNYKAGTKTVDCKVTVK